MNGFRVLVSRTEIRLVWLQDEKEAVVLWLPRAVAEALVPALKQARYAHLRPDVQAEVARVRAEPAHQRAAGPHGKPSPNPRHAFVPHAWACPRAHPRR